MTTIRIRAESMSALYGALDDAGIMTSDVLDPENTYPRNDGNVTIAVLGELTRLTGNTVMDPDGNPVPECEMLPGYHANILTTDPGIIEALAPVTVNPATPLVEFAGVNG